MIDELGICEEEAAACVFFILAWRYIGVGPEMREKALRLLPDSRMDKVPLHIRENLSKRMHKSVCGGGYEWVDRAAPGYSTTIEAMYERKFGNAFNEAIPLVEFTPIDALCDEIRRSRPELNAVGLRLSHGRPPHWLDAEGKPIPNPS